MPHRTLRCVALRWQCRVVSCYLSSLPPSLSIKGWLYDYVRLLLCLIEFSLSCTACMLAESMCDAVLYIIPIFHIPTASTPTWRSHSYRPPSSSSTTVAANWPVSCCIAFVVCRRPATECIRAVVRLFLLSICHCRYRRSSPSAQLPQCGLHRCG